EEGWRKLHRSGARIDAEFVVEGAKGTTVVSREWKPDAKLEEAETGVSAPGFEKAGLGERGGGGGGGGVAPLRDPGARGPDRGRGAAQGSEQTEEETLRRCEAGFAADPRSTRHGRGREGERLHRGAFGQDLGPRRGE